MTSLEGEAHRLIESLRADLWAGRRGMARELPFEAAADRRAEAETLPDAWAEAPGAALARLIESGLDYKIAQSALWGFTQHGIEAEAAFEAAHRQWDWSIDLARLAHDARVPGAAELLARRVKLADRRHGVLAWLLWETGQPEAARLALLDAHPGSASWREDLIARLEISLRCADRPGAAAAFALLAPLLAPQELEKLALTRLWMEDGAAALGAAILSNPPQDHAPTWDFLFQTFTLERDFAPAGTALAKLVTLRADPLANRFDQIRHALDREDPESAAALAAGLPHGEPWQLSPRQLLLELRLGLARIERAREGPAARQSLALLLARARAAARLWPRNTALTGILASLRERAEGWDDLAAELLEGPPGLAQQAGLLRLGLPGPGRLSLAPSALPADPSSRDERLRLEGLLLLETGQPEAVLALPAPRPADSPTRLWLEEPGIEALLWLRRLPEALSRLDHHLARHPARMGLRLQRARARLLAGDFTGAEADLEWFRRSKLAHNGYPPPDDLRDHITRDALGAGAALPLGEPPAASAQRLGPLLTRHPGLAAAWLARPGALPDFEPEIAGTAIPPRFAAYWEGPLPDPARRGFARWQAVLPGWEAQLFDRAGAENWLLAHDPEIARLFAASDPAAASAAGRADLFRAAYIAREGGIFADTDEYPRDTPLPWLEGASAVVVLESGYGTAANNFLAARPQHSLMQRFRAAILARAALADGITDPWWNSGPARLTLALTEELLAGPGAAPAPGLRILSQSAYCARVSTNLPFPHKRGPDHWRSALPKQPPS